MLNIRNYVIKDMETQGVRFILVEYAIGILLPFILGLISIFSGQLSSPQSTLKTVLGFWFVTVAINYVPLMIYAISISRAGTVQEKKERDPDQEPRDRRRQVILAIPFLVVILALAQELFKPKK
jgi:hypothetical protein